MPSRKFLFSLGYSGITNLSDMLVAVVMILAARELGTEGFGALAYAQSLAIIFMGPMTFGLERLIIRETSRDQSLIGSYFLPHAAWKASLGGTMLLVLGAAAWLVPGLADGMVALVLVVAVAWTLKMSAESMQIYFRSLNRYDQEALAAGVSQAIYVVAGCVALAMGVGVLGLALTFLAARVVGLAFTWGCVRRKVAVQWRLRMRPVMLLQKQAVPIGLSMLLTRVYVHVDTLILKAISGVADVGLYGAALKIYLAGFVVPITVSNVLMVKLSTSFAEEDKLRHNRLIIAGSALIGVSSLAVAGVGFAVAPWLMPTVFGEEYRDAVTPMRVLFLAMIVSFQVWYSQTLLVAVDRQRAMVWLSAAGLTARMALAGTLIPYFSVTGAAVALLCSELLMLLICWGYLMRTHFRVRSLTAVMAAIRSPATHGTSR